MSIMMCTEWLAGAISRQCNGLKSCFFCAKMIPQQHLIMEIRFLDIQTLEFCPYTFALDVLLAGTTNTLSNIFLMILCTI